MNDLSADEAPQHVQPDADLRRRVGGTLLIGGSPLRILRLSPGGARVVDGWCRGEPVGRATTEGALAKRLVAGGMFHPADPEPTIDEELPLLEVTIVIPVKDDPAGLSATLASLRSTNTEMVNKVLVVDDGSQKPVELAGTDPSTRVIRHEQNQGPAAARMTGLDLVDTELVAFVDAGVLIHASDLRALTLAVEQQGLVAAAPRVTAPLGAHPSMLDRYEVGRSPLDLGPVAGLVGPGRQVPYVPTACLVARTKHVREVGGFDPTLRFGEDVDLIWRLAVEYPNRIRYLPALTAVHPPRSSVRGMIRQRVSYGSAAGPLHQRHGAAVAPVRTSWWSLGIAGLFAAGHPFLAIIGWASTARALVEKLPEMPDRGIEAAMLAWRGHGWTLRSLARNAIRTWWPITLMALVSPRTRSRALVVIGVGLGERLLEGPAEPAIDLALGLVDDVSYGTGVWLGVWNERTLGPLLPDITSWPPKD